MDIHKPKPWHGLREFLKEYLIIVVGVLTALGGEQLVEAMHWRHVLDEAREDIAADHSRVMGWVGSREAQSKCQAERLEQIEAVLGKAGETGRLPPVGDIGNPGKLSWTMRGWDGVVNSNALAHFPRGEGSRYAAQDRYLGHIRSIRDAEVADWAVLHTITGPGRRLSDTEAANLRGALGRAIDDTIWMRLHVQQVAELVQDSHLLTRAQLLEAWRYGVAQGYAGLCGPIPPWNPASAPLRTPGLREPPSPPVESYDVPGKPYMTRGFRRGGN
jgi:hypothetical protein